MVPRSVGRNGDRQARVTRAGATERVSTAGKNCCLTIGRIYVTAYGLVSPRLMDR